jgi:tetratricopeptide (TPR) repeat protein
MKDEKARLSDDRLVDYLYGEMSPSERESYEQKLSEDTELARKAAELKRVMELFRDNFSEEEVSSAVSSRVLEAAARRKSETSVLDRLAAWVTVPVRRYALGAAVSLVVVCSAVVAVYKLKGRHTDSESRKTATATQPADHRRADSAERTGKDETRTKVALAETAKEEAPPRLPQDEQQNGDADDNGMVKGAGSDTSTAMSFVDGERGSGVRRLPAGKGGALRRRPRVSATGRVRHETMAHSGKGYRGKRRAIEALKKQGQRYNYKRRRGFRRDNLYDGKAPPPQASYGSTNSVSNRERLYRMGLTLQRKGKHRQAINFFSQATAGQPKRDDVILRWAESEIKLGNYRKAEKLLAQVKGRSKLTKNRAVRLTRRLRTLRSRRYARVRARRAASRPQAAQKAAQKKKSVPRKPPRAK